jgi:hypothetical protein
MRASATDNDTIKYAVSTYGGCSVSMNWNGPNAGSAYYNATKASYYNDGSITSTPEQEHNVLVVGWNDAYPAANFARPPSRPGAFLVKNSLGADWGDHGYFWVSYYDKKFARTSAFATFNGVQPVTNYVAVYQYDPLGYTQVIGYGSPTAWFANMFTAESTATVAAVGLYAATPGSSYAVYAGPSLESKVLCASGTLATMGYHTIPLPSPMIVTGGRPFVVAVKMTTTGYGYPIAVEQPIAGYSSGATAAAGQSFISKDGVAWSDVTTWYANTNVCLKAYTVPGPATVANGLPPTGWSKVPVTVDLAAADAGHGVAYTEYRLDGGTFVRGTRVAVTGTGAHTLAYRSADTVGVLEPTKTAKIGIDPTGPTTIAYTKVTVKKGGMATFRFKVSDVTRRANVSFRIYKGTRLKKVLMAGDVKTGSVTIGAWKCTLAKGTYTWMVCATDLAGNRQISIGKKALIVM